MSTRPIGGEPSATWMAYIEELEAALCRARAEAELARELVGLHEELLGHVVKGAQPVSVPVELDTRILGTQRLYSMLLSQKEADE